MLNTFLHPLVGADEVSRDSLQIVTAIYDEGDGLVLCGWHSQGYDLALIHVMLYLNFLGFLCHLLDLYEDKVLD